MPKLSPSWTAERQRQYMRDWRRKNREKCRAYSAQWKRRHPERYRQLKRRYRNPENPLTRIQRTWGKRARDRRKLGVEFTITPQDLQWPTHCPVLGMELDYTGKDPRRSWSLDRLDPTLGYIPGNVHIISKRANTIKSDATFEELQAVALWIGSLRSPTDYAQ